VYMRSPLRKGWAVRFWWAGCFKCIRADPCGCAYGSVCGHRAFGMCGPEMGHTTCHMRRHWTYDRVLRGKVPGHLFGLVYGHMHARVALGWGT
jgi:hypothetical protein